MSQATRTVTITGRTGATAQVTITAYAEIEALTYNADGHLIETSNVRLNERCEITAMVGDKLIGRDYRIAGPEADAAAQGCVARIGSLSLMPESAAIVQAAYDAVMAEITTPEIVAHKAQLAKIKAARDLAEEQYEAHRAEMGRRMGGGH